MITSLLYNILSYNVTEEEFLWILNQVNKLHNSNKDNQLVFSFAKIPARIKRETLFLKAEDDTLLSKSCPLLKINEWTKDKFCRVLLLNALPENSKESYLNTIRELVDWADMDELAAFYAALSFLKYPEEWKECVLNGIRSNIDLVLEAILYHNPYPSNHLDEASWNQMICKAFFTNKKIINIAAIDERANNALAKMLTGYASERIAAGRTVPPQLWRLVAPFMTDKGVGLIKILLKNADENEIMSLILACLKTPHTGAKKILADHPEMCKYITSENLNWNTLNSNAYVLQ